MSQWQLSPGRNVAVPSEVIPPGGRAVSEPPCPFCGAVRTDGPEGASWDIDWHCWKCGFRPDVNAGVSNYQRQQQFEAFNRWLDNQMSQDVAHPSLNVPSSESDVAAMQARIAELEGQINNQGG